jgi:hypothetical protein
LDDIYDIFERRPEGAMWVESFVGLHGIDGRLTHLHSQRSGKYFVYSVHDAKVIAEFPRDTNTGSPAAEAAPLHQVTPSLDELSGTNGNGANGSGATGTAQTETALLLSEENTKRFIRIGGKQTARLPNPQTSYRRNKSTVLPCKKPFTLLSRPTREPSPESSTCSGHPG